MSDVNTVLFSKKVDGKYEDGQAPTGYTNNSWIMQDLPRIQDKLKRVEMWNYRHWPDADPPTEKQIEWMKEQDGKLAYCKVRTKEEIEADNKERIENGEEPRNYDDVGLEVWATRDLDAAFRDSLAKVRAIEAAEKIASEKAKRDGMKKAEESDD